jgi:large subunit ribosomal protein L35
MSRPDPPGLPASNRGETFHMPKMKSHTGMGKRVKVTGSGKIVAQQAGLRHNLEKKATTRTRRLTGTVEVAQNDVKRIKKLLGR